jgi:hypothetical protein
MPLAVIGECLDEIGECLDESVAIVSQTYEKLTLGAAELVPSDRAAMIICWVWGDTSTVSPLQPCYTSFIPFLVSTNSSSER